MNFLARPISPRFCFADSYLALPTVALALFAALSMLGIERAHGQTVSPSVINGPTIVQHRCSPFSNDYLQFSSSGPVITGGLSFGLQNCVSITYPTQPILVSQGQVAVVIPVVFLGDNEMTPKGNGIPPPSYPFGRSDAVFNITVTATDLAGAPAQAQLQPNPPIANPLCAAAVLQPGPVPNPITPPPPASAQGTVTLFDFAAPNANPSLTDNSNRASANITLFLNLDWAVSLLTISIQLKQEIPGQSPKVPKGTLRNYRSDRAAGA